MSDSVEINLSTPDKFNIIEDIIKKKRKNKDFLHLTYQAYKISSILKNQVLVISESLKNSSNVSIFDHQILAAKKILFDFNGTGMLADEVGLGKTIEAGIILKELIVTGRINNALILTPPSLVPQWKDELSTKFDLEFLSHLDDDFKGFSSHNYVVASLSTALQPKNLNSVYGKTWDIVLVDEAHSLKNSETQKHIFVKNIPKKKLILLTATPVQNNLKELYNLMDLLQPGILGNWKEFKRIYVDSTDLRKVNPITKDYLQELISDLVIRNTRKEVGEYIKFTNRIANTHIVYPSADERKLYTSITAKIRNLYQSNSSPLVLMGYQKNISSSTYSTKNALKTMKTSEIISSDEYDEFMDMANKSSVDCKMNHLLNIIKNNGSKFLIFCEYIATQNYIFDCLTDAGLDVEIFNGTMDPSQKKEAVNNFKNNVQILISTGAGGEGQNLQFCSNIVNYDLPWNPMNVEQRIGRVHRIGQKRDVQIHNYAVKNTIEEYILDLLYTKIELFTLTLGELDVMFENLSPNEITQKFFKQYMNSVNAEEIKNKFTVLGNEWKKNKSLVQDTVSTFNQNVFKNFSLGSVENG